MASLAYILVSFVWIAVVTFVLYQSLTVTQNDLYRWILIQYGHFAAWLKRFVIYRLQHAKLEPQATIRDTILWGKYLLISFIMS